jgi:hypothetical protein
MSEKERQTSLLHFGKGVGVLPQLCNFAGQVWPDLVVVKAESDLMDWKVLLMKSSKTFKAVVLQFCWCMEKVLLLFTFSALVHCDIKIYTVWTYVRIYIQTRSKRSSHVLG